MTAKNIFKKAAKIFLPFVLIPALVLLGATALESRRHLWVSFGVALLSLVLFYSSYERKNVGSRRMVIVAVMTALCIVGRFIPLFKPISALTIITAIYIGAESGFLVGSLAALFSNFYFGQGPWTPFQMLAWGLIGLFAGYISGALKKNFPFLLIYGALSGLVFSFIMDIFSVIWYNGSFSLSLYLAAMLTALPHTIAYTLSNIIFLLFFAKPFGAKLERIKIKYGI